LVQHDDIKKEIIKQDGLQLLFKCTTLEATNIDSKDKNVIIRRSLTTLWKMVCNKDIASVVKILHEEFIEKLKLMTNPTAANILWELEGKAKILDEKHHQHSQIVQNKTTKKYDLMISYSHADKIICHKLYDYLTQDKYKVWIDKTQMGGRIDEAIADSIENSHIILMCMSDTYKDSAWCQSEATYAREIGTIRLPLKLQSKLQREGWL
ncbi:unnamed protein product, partial [Didymodactylos carnosus]